MVNYEEVLILDDMIIYPDFTIRHPITGETYYWEHFGMMDDPVYREKTVLKLKNYINHQIIPTHQLITTYETRSHPLDLREVEKIVQMYFLS